MTETQTWHVLKWQISAKPVATPAAKGKEAASTSTTATVEVDLALDADVDEQLPALWPNAAGGELLRATGSSSGLYTVVRSLKQTEIQAPVKSVETVYTVNGVRQPRRHYKFAMTDPDAKPGVRCFYKLRFLDRRQQTLVESGYCSVVPLVQPTPRRDDDPDGFVRIHWDAVNLRRDDFDEDPRWVVRLRGVHDLARLPLESTEFRTPLKSASLDSGSAPLELALSALVRRDEWDSEFGQRSAVEHVEISRAVSLPAVSPEQGAHAFFESMSRRAITVESASSANNPNAGRVRVRWNMPGELRLTSFDVQSPSRGARRWTQQDRSIYNISLDNRVHEFRENLGGPLGAYNCAFEPGECEPITCTYTWREHLKTTNSTTHGFSITTSTAEVGPLLTARVTLVRPPLPSGLTASAGNGQVTLRWNGFRWSEKDWAEGPWFVLLRSDETRVSISGGKMDVRAEQEILRTNALVTSFVDRGVTNGKLYLYTLRIEGVTRATSWNHDAGEYPCLLPVQVGVRMRDGQRFVSALPEGLEPLRVALLAADTQDPRVNAIQAQCFRALRATSWMELVERSAGAALLDEEQIAKLQSIGPGPAPAAEIVLQCRVRQSGYRHMFDVWLDDMKNAHRERLLSQSLDDFTLEQVTQQLVGQLAARYPTQAASFPASLRQTCAPIEKIAITEMRPLSTNVLAAGGFESLLTAMITKDECVKVVDREKLALALKELATAKLTDQEHAVRLGHMVTADAILSGYYAISDGQMALSARLIDAGTGEIINVFELAGKSDDPQTLCEQLAQQVLMASKIGRTTVDSPLLRWMESQVYRDASDKLTAAKTAAYVSPETLDYHFQIGQEQKQRGALEDALGSFYNGLNLATKPEDAWRFYTAIGELLDSLHRPEEAVKLWDGAVTDCRHRRADPSAALLNLARSYHQLHRENDALAALDAIPEPSRTYAVGREYESLGRTNTAVAVYGRNGSVGPGYAALIRLLQDASPDMQTDLLRTIVTKVGAPRPHQTRKALEELQRRGVPLTANLIKSAEAIRVANSRDPLIQMFEQIVREKPNSLEAMRALGQLATWNRTLGNDEASRQQFQQLLSLDVRGEEADDLRQMATIRMRMDPSKPGRGLPTSETSVVPPIVEKISSDLDGKLVVDSMATVYRLTPDGKTVVWRFNPCAHGTYSHSTNKLWYNSSYGIDHWISDLRLLADSMVIDGDTLYAPDLIDGTLNALDIHTGSLNWAFVDWAPITKPLLINGQLLLGDSLGSLFELDRKSGAVRRSVRCPAEFIERGYHEQLLKIALTPSQDAISFIDPSRTGRYRFPDGSKELEFESHRFTLDFRAAGVGDLSLIPYGDLPDNLVVIEGSLARVHDPRLATDAGLRTQASQGRSPLERAADVVTLSQRFGRAYVPKLQELLNDPAADVRRTAALCLGQLGDKTDLVALAALLRDPDEKVRVQVVESIEALGGLDARQWLTAALQDASSRVRGQATLELVKAGDSSLIPALKQSDILGTWRRNGDALVALCKADDTEAWEELKKQLGFGYTGVELVDSAQLVTRSLPDPRLVPTLRQTLRRLQNNLMAPYVAEALGRIGDPAVVPDLLEFLPYTTSGGGGEKFVTALENLTGQSFGMDRGRWDVWWANATPSLRHGSSAQPSP